MVAFEMIPATPVELTLRRKRLSGNYRILQGLIALKGIELQYQLVKNGGKANEITFQIGQEIVLLRAKLADYEEGIIHLDGMISWLEYEELAAPARLAS
jgi:hypothetical protein